MWTKKFFVKYSGSLDRQWKFVFEIREAKTDESDNTGYPKLLPKGRNFVSARNVVWNLF